MRTLTVLLVVLVPLAAAAQISFERLYGGSQDEWGYSVDQTADGGYIIAGWTESFGAGLYDVYLVRTDGVGDTVWTRTYGGSGYELAYSVEQTADGGYIIAGETESYGAGLDDVLLIKIDAVGDTVWTRTYGGAYADYSESVQQTEDGGYIIAGATESFGAGADDVYLLKTDAAGDTVWTRTHGGPNTDWSHSVRQTADGGYIIVGWTVSFGAGGADMYVVKTDASGDTVWTRTYGGSGFEVAHSVEQTTDGGYIIAGRTESFGAGFHDVYMVRTDSLGDTVWTRTYGGSGHDEAYSVGRTVDGGYIIAGRTTSFGMGPQDVYLIKTDAVGDTVWTRTHGGNSWEAGRWVEQTADGGYIVTGWTESFTAIEDDIYLIKTDADGVVGVADDDDEVRPRAHYLAQNRPNPFGSSTTIVYSLRVRQPVSMRIYDIRGALVRELVKETVSVGVHRVSWDGRDGRGRSVGSGLYFCRLEAGEVTETRRMVLLR